MFDLLVKEGEWHADDDETTVGVLFRDGVDSDRAYAILQQVANA